MKNKAQRDELHRTIWKIANDLRGSIDGWDFKQYVLGTLFYRYISENFTKYINDGEREAGDIKPYSTLIFDVELVGIDRPEPETPAEPVKSPKKAKKSKK